MPLFTSFARRAGVVLVTLSLMLGAAACGGSDDGDGADAKGAASTTEPLPDFGEPAAGDEREVADALDELYGDLENGDAGAACERMGQAALEQLGGAEGDCDAAVEALIERAERSGSLERIGEAKVGAVEVEGDKASATVSFGAQAARLPLRRTEGEWLLAGPIALPSAAPATADE